MATTPGDEAIRLVAQVLKGGRSKLRGGGATGRRRVCRPPTEHEHPATQARLAERLRSGAWRRSGSAASCSRRGIGVAFARQGPRPSTRKGLVKGERRGSLSRQVRRTRNRSWWRPVRLTLFAQPYFSRRLPAPRRFMLRSFHVRPRRSEWSGRVCPAQTRQSGASTIRSLADVLPSPSRRATRSPRVGR